MAGRRCDDWPVATARLMGRQAETQVVAEFLATASTQPAALVVEGQPGLGKTTVWLEGVEQARDRGFHVLTARPAEAESALSHSALADLLGDVDAGAWSELPEPQRFALDRVLLRTDAGAAATDARAVAAALRSLLQRLAVHSPVLVAIDDLQWLDTSSAQAIGFAVRRLTGRVAVFVTTRDDRESVNSTSWLQLPTPDAIRRISLPPLTLRDLHDVITGRIGRSFPRPTMLEIHQASGGNPFYGLELARSVDDEGRLPTSLPGSLAELVSARIGSLEHGLRQVLLAVACLAVPTVDLVARATGGDGVDVMSLVEEAESIGILEIDGIQLRFAHPLLARGVYADAAPRARRSMHGRLAGLVEEPESQARHLALGATVGSSATLESLDVAAELARKRGAPAAAAELLDLAIHLGGGTPMRRIRSAGHHLRAGNADRARALLDRAVADLPLGGLRANALMLLAVVELFDDSYLEGVGVLDRGLREVGEDVALKARMLVTSSFALLNVGRTDEALEKVEEAVDAATRSALPSLLGQALGMRAMARFVHGDGFDQSDMRRALDLADSDASMPIAFRPAVHHALLLAWSGQLHSAREGLNAIRRDSLERGVEGDVVFVSFHACFVAIWLGDMVEAARLAEDTVERAQQLGGNVSLFVALTTRAATRSYTGHEDAARADLDAAMAASMRSGFVAMVQWPVTVRGFLEVSLGNHQAALDTLSPLMAQVLATPEATEMIGGAFLPDAIEALIHLDRLEEAEALIDVLERNGHRLDRPWMLAVAGRCRAMVLAARGDVDGAHVAADRAMVEHDRVPMPFERARTQLVLGAIQRRRRQEVEAAESIKEAWRVFEHLGTPLWAARANAAMDDTQTHRLTPSEQKVARLTATGMTNAEVAAALFISPKTVEFHLAGIYRKLGIRSRAELGSRMGKLSQ